MVRRRWQELSDIDKQMKEVIEKLEKNNDLPITAPKSEHLESAERATELSTTNIELTQAAQRIDKEFWGMMYATLRNYFQLTNAELDQIPTEEKYYIFMRLVQESG